MSCIHQTSVQHSSSGTITAEIAHSALVNCVLLDGSLSINARISTKNTEVTSGDHTKFGSLHLKLNNFSDIVDAIETFSSCASRLLVRYSVPVGPRILVSSEYEEYLFATRMKSRLLESFIRSGQ